jgi:hypothetical protein
VGHLHGVAEGVLPGERFTRASGAGLATSGFDAGVRVDAYCGFRDTSSVTAREIASDGELQAIAAAGVGFVITPFNRRWPLRAGAINVVFQYVRRSLVSMMSD